VNKLADLIKKLSPEDLALLKKDLEQGNISRLISDRMAELEMPQKVCPICNSPLEDDAPYVLYFGSGIRKKARFDGTDCLKFFIEELEK
jgi:hypothetical protein